MDWFHILMSSRPINTRTTSHFACMNLIQITKRRHTHHKLKGHIVTLPQNPSKGTSTHHQLKKVLQVRKSKITIALKWLFDYNKLFKNNIQLDKNNLNNLLEGEIPEALMVTIMVVDIDFHKTEHYPSYTCDQQESDSKSDNSENDNSENDKLANIDKHSLKNFIRDNSINSAKKLRPSGIIDVDDVPIIRKELTLLFFKKLIDKPDYNEQLPSNKNMHRLKSIPIQSHILKVFHSNKPLNEYKDLTLLPVGFPVLFPYGVGGYEANLVSSLKPEDIDFAVKQVQNNQSISNPAVIELLKNVNSASSKLMASHQSHSRMCNKICAVIMQDGTPSLFITINPADLHSSIVMMYIRKEIDLQNLSPKNFPKASERAWLAHLDPIAVAKYFNVIIQAIIDTLIRYKRKDNDIFSLIRNYYSVVKYQDHGILYCHMFVWLHGARDLLLLHQKLKTDNEFCECLLHYVSSIVRKDINYFMKNKIINDATIKAKYEASKT
ncbi:5886_t:CDS:2, partial [Cetraspora pellucida]